MLLRYLDRYHEGVTLFRGLWREIFADRFEFEEFYHKVICENNKILGAYENGELIGMIHLNPYQVNGELSYYIVGVAVREEYRGQSVMRQMMNKVLSDMKDEGVRLAFLMPKDQAYYLSFGFEQVYETVQLNINLNEYPMDASGSDLQASAISKMTDKTKEMLASSINMMLAEQCKYYCERNVQYLTNYVLEHTCQNGDALSLFDGYEFAGTIAYDEFDDTLYVERIAVSEKYTKRVLNHILKLAKSKGLNKVYMVVPKKPAWMELTDNMLVEDGCGIMAISPIDDFPLIHSMKNHSFFDEII